MLPKMASKMLLNTTRTLGREREREIKKERELFERLCPLFILRSVVGG
jgi:hypothetical protein